MDTDYLFYVKFIDIYAPTFLSYNNSVLAMALQVINALSEEFWTLKAKWTFLIVGCLNFGCLIHILFMNMIIRVRSRFEFQVGHPS